MFRLKLLQSRERRGEGLLHQVGRVVEVTRALGQSPARPGREARPVPSDQLLARRELAALQPLEKDERREVADASFGSRFGALLIFRVHRGD
ncbi:MAG: hypothetical protein U0527_06825 [Candidatus Eisenbacteria bacterium]